MSSSLICVTTATTYILTQVGAPSTYVPNLPLNKEPAGRLSGLAIP